MRRCSPCLVRSNAMCFSGFVQGKKIKTQPVIPQSLDNDDVRCEAVESIFSQKEAMGLSSMLHQCWLERIV